MPDVASAMRQALEDGDHRQMARIFAEVAPHLPQPKTDAESEIMLHRARTECEALPLKPRAWSHRWLTERGIASSLPDQLRPSAERLYPRVAEMVGVFVKPASEASAPAVGEIQQAMSDAVEEAYADGRTDPEFVRGRMMEARARARKQLFGGTHG